MPRVKISHRTSYTWIELAPSAKAGVMRYRCGIPFAPLYKTGLSTQAQGIIDSIKSRAN